MRVSSPQSTHRGQLDIANATSLRAFSDHAMTPRRCCKSSTAKCPPSPSESHPIAFRSRPDGDALQGPRVAAIPLRGRRSHSDRRRIRRAKPTTATDGQPRDRREIGPTGKPGTRTACSFWHYEPPALRGRHARLRLNQQAYEADKQGATEDHGPVPDIETEKPAVGRHKFELHERPLLGLCSHSLRNGSAHCRR